LKYIKRLFKPPEGSYFLFGPRGIGKSTLLKSLYGNNAIWVDLLLPDLLRSYLANPERLHNIVTGQMDKKIVVIDEVQRVPGLLTVVHSLIEERKELQFILSGSSARKLKRTGADLLGGRALRRELYPFMASELGEKFSLTDAITNGLLPLVFDKKNPQDSLQGYINLYLNEEIQAEGLVRNLESFIRFLEVISFSHASILNVTNISRECEVKRKTVENYIGILEDLLLGYQLQVFTKQAQREIISHPKFYLFDAGVFHALRPKGLLDKTQEIEGAALEGLVAQHLRAWNEYSKEKHLLAFWRTRSGVEVDFVIYGNKNFWGIEVKNSKRVMPQDTKSLETFLSDYPEAKGLLLYRGHEIIKQKNVICVPCDIFLKQLEPDKEIWPA